jgi:hypothetical protein
VAARDAADLRELLFVEEDLQALTHNREYYRLTY